MPDFSSLNYHSGWGGDAGVLSQAPTEAKNSSRVDALQLIWSALLEKPLTMHVKDYRKRLQPGMCVSHWWTLLRYNVIITLFI